MRTRMIQQNEKNTLKVMMYIFPRQFGLHNVFTSKVNTKETSQRLKDYTLREEEIFEKFGRLGDDDVQVKIPKRLRGLGRDLVHKLQAFHRRCSYAQLLQHYCPVRLMWYHPAGADMSRFVSQRMHQKSGQNMKRSNGTPGNKQRTS